jgi:hypothetical protein
MKLAVIEKEKSIVACVADDHIFKIRLTYRRH